MFLGLVSLFPGFEYSIVKDRHRKAFFDRRFGIKPSQCALSKTAKATIFA
jgi:hypothetical protein